MNMDSITSVYSDTRSEYTKQLCIYLVPAYFQFFVDLLEKTKKTVEPKKALWQFQTYLNEVHEWNMEKVCNEITLIHKNTGCDYLDDLLTAVFIAHTKVLTAIRLSVNNKKIEITIPKVEHFLFKVLCEISKLLWSSTYLFRQDISGIDQQQNYKAIEGIINEGITQAIRSLVPVKSILKNLVNQEEKSESKTEEDSDEEDVRIAKPITEPSTTALPEPSAAASPEPSVLAASIKPSVPVSSIEPSIEQEQSSTEQPLQPLVSLDEPTEPDTIETEHHDSPSTTDESPMIINLDEKPKVSFASFNSLFSSEDPDKSNMIEANTTYGNDDNDTPDLEIIDQTGSLLSSDDFEDILEPNGTPMNSNDYEEL